MSLYAFCFLLLSWWHLRLFRLTIAHNLWKGREKQRYRTYSFSLVVVSEFLISISSGEQNFFDEIDMIETRLCVGKSWKMPFLLLILSNRTHSKCTCYFLHRKIESKRTHTIIKIIENGWKTTTPLHHVFFTNPSLSNVVALGRIQTLAEKRKTEKQKPITIRTGSKQYILLFCDWLLLFFFPLFYQDLNAPLGRSWCNHVVQKICNSGEGYINTLMFRLFLRFAYFFVKIKNFAQVNTFIRITDI